MLARVLQVCAVDFTAFHMLRPLLLASREAGLEAEFACADGPWAARLRAEGFVQRVIPTTRAVSPAMQARSVVALAHSLRRRPPDLIHTHTPIGGFVGRSAALTWRGPVVHTFHGMPFEGTPRTVIDRLFLLVERLLAKRTTCFFSQARGDAARAIDLSIARWKDTLVIGNGVDVARFTPDQHARAEGRRQLGFGEHDVVVVSVARAVREKGLLELADAAVGLVDLANLHFLIIGSALDSDRTSIAGELDRHPVVERLGRRWRRMGQRDDVPAILQAADIFVLPTYREGLPRSIIEAMAAGLPVIATTIPACRELVRERQTGLLVPPRDVGALGAALRVLALDPGLRRAMGEVARDIAEAEHDERRVVDLQVGVYRRLLGSRVSDE